MKNMKNISKLSMTELSTCMIKMTEPATRLFSDGAVCEALDEMKKRMGDGTTAQIAFSLFTTILHPVLMGEKHADDTYAILAALSGKTVNEIKAANGLKTMRDMFKAFVLDGDVQAMFRPGTEVRGE